MNARKKFLAALCAACCLFTQAAQAKKLAIIYVPLDNRPVCTAYVRQTMEAAGCEIIMPPEKYIADHFHNGNADAILDWLETKAPKAGAAVISTDSLIYGGLVASRLHNIAVPVLTERLRRLNELPNRLPIKLYAFSTVMRTPRASFGNVEPPYYAKIGSAIFTYSELTDKSEQNTLSLADQLLKQALERNLPRLELTDWLERREKNFNVNRELTLMARSGRFHYLAIGKDDNAPLSATHMEARKLNRSAFDLGNSSFQILAGVDQLGLLLLTRAYNEALGDPPAVYPLYSVGAGAATLPQYSDARLQDSVPQQIIASGAQVAATPDSAGLILALNTPADGITKDASSADNKFFAAAADKLFIKILKTQLNQRRKITLADVKYANGADNGFMDALAKDGLLPQLVAYNGWNTADNTIGYAIAQGIMSQTMTPQAALKLLRQRLIDDWYYQSNVRPSLGSFLEKQGRKEEKYALGRSARQVLDKATAECLALANKYALTKGTEFTLSFPWERLFEVDVELKK